MSESVHVAVAAARADLRPVGMDSTNTQQGWNYRSAEALISAVGPVLAAHGVNIGVDYEITNERDVTYQRGGSGREITVRCWLRLIGPAGDEISSSCYAAAQSAGSAAISAAQTMAYKQALGQALAVPYIGEGLGEPDEGSATEYSAAAPSQPERPARASEQPQEARQASEAGEGAAPASGALQSRVRVALAMIAALPEPARAAAMRAVREAGWSDAVSQQTRAAGLRVLAITSDLDKFTGDKRLHELRNRAYKAGWSPELWQQMRDHIGTDDLTLTEQRLTYLVDADLEGALAVWGADDGPPVVMDAVTNERLLFTEDGQWHPAEGRGDSAQVILAQLQNQCKRLNLPTSGTASQLRDRIRAARDG